MFATADRSILIFDFGTVLMLDALLDTSLLLYLCLGATLRVNPSVSGSVSCPGNELLVSSERILPHKIKSKIV